MNSLVTVGDAVKKTADLFSTNQLEYVTLPCVSHTPAMEASQRLWMDWIGDQFAGVESSPTFRRSVLASVRPSKAYDREIDCYLETDSRFHQTP